MSPAPAMRLLAFSSVAFGAKVTPVQQVINMLTDMKAKGEEEMAKEVALHREIEKSVLERLTSAGLDIDQNTDRMNRQKAKMDAAQGAAEQLGIEIEEHKETNLANGGSLTTRKSERQKKAADDEKELTDRLESEDALTRAIAVLSQSQGAIPASMIQKIAAAVPSARADLEAYLQQPQATQNAYESQSGNILKLLKDLLKDFKEQVHKKKSDMANEQSAFQTFRVDMEYQIKGIEKMIVDKTTEMGHQTAVAGEADGKMQDALKALTEARELKDSTEQYEETQNKSFEENQKNRAEEIEALSKAIGIMGSPEVSGAADKHMPGDAASPAEETAFLQISAVLENRAASAVQRSLLQRATELVTARNKSLFNNRSRALSMLSAQMLTGGTFDKVIDMIDQLIEKLQEEASAELEHKEWCDKQLEETTTDKSEQETKVEGITAEKAGMEAQVAENEANIKELTGAVAELNKALTEATKLRNSEAALNKETKEDAMAAVTACTRAVDILRRFYGDSTAAGLLQSKMSAKADPEIASYTGMSDASGGVIGLIETILADFTKLEVTTEQNELQAFNEFKQFREDSENDLNQKRDESNKLTVENVTLTGNIAGARKKLELATNQLTQITEYWAALQPMCVVKHVSYEERVEKRKEEIQALKDAYKVLSEQSGEV